MSKVICEVCGTTYPDTGTQCPICGCVRATGKQTGDTQHSAGEQKSPQHTAVRGGRYSKANVRKRMAAVPASVPGREKDPPKGKKSGKGLIVLAVILLLAVVAVLVFVALRFFGPFENPDPKPGETDSTPGSQTENVMPEDTEPPTLPPEILCTDLILSTTELELNAEGQAWLLNVKPLPENTTQEIVYASSNSGVVSVSAQGKVMAVAPGRAEITVTCGDVTKTCRVKVTYAEETETTEATEAPTEPEENVLELNREDITLAYAGEYWDLYSGGIAKPLITWSSDDESVATFVNGRVTAVGPGMTEVHAEYNGVKVSCIIRCSFTAGIEGGGFNTGVGEDGGN